VVVERAVPGEHAEDDDVAGPEVGAQQARAARVGEADMVLGAGRLAGAIARDIETARRLDQIGEAMRALDHDQRATASRRPKTSARAARAWTMS